MLRKAPAPLPVPDIAPIVADQTLRCPPDAPNGYLVGSFGCANSPWPAEVLPSEVGGTGSGIFRIEGTPGGSVFRVYVDDNTDLPAADLTTLTLLASYSNGVSPAGSNTISIQVDASELVFIQSFGLSEFANAASPGYFRVPLGFKKGDVPDGSSIVCQIGGETLDHVQFDNIVRWSDDSIALAIMRADFADFAAAQTKTFSVYRQPGGSFDNTTAGTIADIDDVLTCEIADFSQTGAVLTAASISSSTNLAGEVTAIDEDPVSPDVNWLTATSPTADTMVHVGFAPPSFDLAEGAGLQQFRVRVRKTAGSANPQARLHLYEAGVLLASGSLTAVTSTGGNTLTLTWDAALLSDITGADVEIRIEGTATGSNTVEIGAVAWTTTEVRGDGAALATFQDHAAVETRVTRFCGGPVCDGFKAWGKASGGADGSGDEDAHAKFIWYVERYKDRNGDEVDVEFAAVVAQDDWSIPGKFRLNYDLTLKREGATVQAYAGLQHPYHSRMRTSYMGNDAGHGRRHWKTARPTLFYQPDQAYWIEAGLALPLDLDLSLTSAADRGWQNTVVPFAGMSHKTGIADGGGGPSRGVWPAFDVVAFGRQTADDLRCARANAHAGMHIPYHFMSNNNRTRSGESADVANTVTVLKLDPQPSGDVDFTADGMPAAVHAYNAPTTALLYKDGFVDALGGTGVWTQLEQSNSHTPNYCEFMYRMEGDEEWLDEVLSAAVGGIQRFLGNEFGGRAQAHGYRDTAFRAAFSIPATYWGGIILYHAQPRSMAWGANLLGVAASLVPEDHEAGRYIRALNAHNGDFIAQSITAPYLPQSALDAGTIMANGIVAPWEVHFQTMCVCRNFILTEDPGFGTWAEVLANHAAGAPSRGEFYKHSYRNLYRPMAAQWAAGTNEYFPVGERRFAVQGSISSSTNRVTLSLTGNGAWSLPLTAGDDFYFSTTDISTAFNTIALPAEVTAGTRYWLGDIVGSTAKIYRDSGLTDEVVFGSNTSVVVLGIAMQATDDYAVAANPPGIPSSDNEIMQGYAALVMAHQAGFEVATQELVDDFAAFVAPIARNTTPVWALKG